MLHIAVLRIGKSLLLQSGGIELDEVTGNVLHLRLHPLLHAFPSSTTNPVQTRWLTFLALVLRHLVQGVNGHIHSVLVLVGDLDHLLHHIALWNAYKTSESSHTMVDMHHVIANLKLLNLLERQCHLAPMCLITLEVVLMETVEDLMIGEETELQRVVNKSFVDGFVDRREVDGIRLRLCLFFEDVLQTGNLLLAVGKDTDLISLVHQAMKLLTDQIKILVE